MNIDPEQLINFLKDSGIASPDKIEDIYEEAKHTDKNIGELFIEKKVISEEELLKISAYILGIPFVVLDNIEIPADVLKIIPEPIAKEHNIVAFQRTENELKVAMLDPEDLQTVEFIKKKTGFKILPSLTTKTGIKNALKQYQKSLEAEFKEFIKTDIPDFDITVKQASGDEKKDENDLEKIAQDLPIIKIVDTLLKHAILQRASDIHIEPEEKDVIVRYRIDGVLYDMMMLPRAALEGIIARIKVLSSLKLDEHRLPQDGRFKIESDEYKISFRVSVLPVYDGEKIVMRLLDEGSKRLKLEDLGFQAEALDKLKRNIERPNGMILVTGPTGSGKTTTLYTVLGILNTTDVNINTIEDPIEYRMARINQTQVKAQIGLTFASGLRTLLRQDPDIIMVGEIRDKETAEMAIHASLTGHLVLSTLHTNNAAGTIPRLLDMGIESFLVASTAKIIIAQRLVRKICSECKATHKLKKDEVEKLGELFDAKKTLAILKREKIIKDGDDFTTIAFSKGNGCNRCMKEGYKGRMGIYEVLEVTENIASLINKNANAAAIEKAAIDAGMITMLEDGIIKAVQGITTIEEVLRVTQE